MKKIYKNLIFFAIIIFSILVAMFDINSFLINSNQVIQLLFTLLALCLTAYTFIYSPIFALLNESIIDFESNKFILTKLLKEYEDDMKFIFFAAILIIIISTFKCIDLPFIIDYKNVEFGFIKIESIKLLIYNFVISLISCFSFLSLYDLIDATFKILRKSIELKASKNN